MNNIEILFESYLFPNGKAKLKYSFLTEAEKVTFKKEMITKLFNTLKNKSLKVNYAGLEKVKGDITKHPKFSDLENSIKILEKMYKSNPSDAPMEILNCVRVLDILKKNKAAFTNAYAKNNDAAQLLFVNIAAALTIGTSKLIAVTIEYIKQPDGSYKAVFKEKSKTLMKNDTYFLSLNRFISMDKTGQLKQVFNMSNKLSEDTTELLGFGPIAALMDISISAVGAVVGIVGVTIWACYNLPYIIYGLRHGIAQHFLNLAYFLEEHAHEIDTTTEKGRKAQEKQLRLVEKLKAIGKFFAIDEEQAERKAEEEKKKDEEQAREEVEKEEKENDTSSGQNNSSDDDGDILL